MKDNFSQKDVNEIFTDVPRETLLFWAKGPLVQWVGESTDGRGLHREYGLVNLYQFGVVRELAALNLSLDWIRNLMEWFFFAPQDINKIRVLSRAWAKEFPDFPDYLKYDSEFHQKPVWEKTLVLFKLKSSMRVWEHSTGGFVICDLDDIDFIIKRKPVAFSAVYLPAITKYVHSQIKEVEEITKKVKMTDAEKVEFIKKYGLKGFKQYLRGNWKPENK
jgi:hypothetical protein